MYSEDSKYGGIVLCQSSGESNIYSTSKDRRIPVHFCLNPGESFLLYGLHNVSTTSGLGGFEVVSLHLLSFFIVFSAFVSFFSFSLITCWVFFLLLFLLSSTFSFLLSFFSIHPFHLPSSSPSPPPPVSLRRWRGRRNPTSSLHQSGSVTELHGCTASPACKTEFW